MYEPLPSLMRPILAPVLEEELDDQEIEELEEPDAPYLKSRWDYGRQPLYLPTPEEIEEQTALIRSDWDEAEYEARAHYQLDFFGDYGTPRRLHAFDRGIMLGYTVPECKNYRKD